MSSESGFASHGVMRPVGVAARSWLSRIVSTATVPATGFLLLFLWQLRDEGHLTPESGFGYALGIAGVAAMLLLLTYPLRKRLRFMFRWGHIETWFRAHMLLGVVATAMILVHSNFRFGSLNSSVALSSLLLVAASGFVGRVIYARIHFGLYGARASLAQLRDIVDEDARLTRSVLATCPAVGARLDQFARDSLAPSSSLLQAALRILLIGMRTRWLHFGARRAVSCAVREEARRHGWSRAHCRAERRAALGFVAGFLGTVRKTVQFTFYERLFALWHVLHVPLFFMLLLTVIGHVIAVHMY